MKKVTTILSLILAVGLVGMSCKDKASNKIVADNVESASMEGISVLATHVDRCNKLNNWIELIFKHFSIVNRGIL